MVVLLGCWLIADGRLPAGNLGDRAVVLQIRGKASTSCLNAARSVPLHAEKYKSRTRCDTIATHLHTRPRRRLQVDQ